MLEILFYNKTTDKYDTRKVIYDTEKLSFTFVQRDYPGHDELTLRLKPTEFTRSLVPQNVSSNIKPIIVTNKEGDTIRWFSFITGRELAETKEDSYVELKGVGFTFFNKYKLLNANTNFTDTGEELPETFATYSKSTNLKNHLEYAYNIYLNPMELTFGKLSTAQVNYRKFKGLSSVNITTNTTDSKSVRTEQKPMDEFITHLYELYKKELVTRQYIRNNKIEIEIVEPKVIDKQLTNRLASIQENLLTQVETINLIFATGWGNNYNSVHDIREWEFTSLEKSEDVSFVSRNNNTYLTNTGRTYLKKETQERLTNILKIELRNVFTEINCGDILGFNGRKYRIRQIQETESLDNYSVDVEIEEVE